MLAVAVGEKFPGGVEEGAGFGGVVFGGGKKDVEGRGGRFAKALEELGGAVEPGEEFAAEGEEFGRSGGRAGAGNFLVAGGKGGEGLVVGGGEGAVVGEVGSGTAEFETVVFEGDGGVRVKGRNRLRVGSHKRRYLEVIVRPER